ncbi:MAG TPA: TetR family transcriptional regulator [Actinophytocola sp.]|uniref:TetR/AcrR family transcriptional regulator n=1 Tax=Actinophytocola sp. TaxID=1872138 RepID=UPI002DDCEA88|nr:TetR family transcriptional regulator [Actinophytocola sp.]HEV2778985.1 TetR family transcriptional regulator [Actinophytocola sp.]
MPRPVKSRGYHSPLRAEQARRTRTAILDAARRLFTEKGYAATTVATIAAEAGVAVDTVYAAVGPKPAVFRLLVETAISGTDQAVPAEQRDYVQRIREAGTARRKIELYAAAVRAIGERMAPLFLVLRAAAPHADELAGMHREIGERRARNMRLFAKELATTGELRSNLSLEEIADIIWSMNSAEFYALLVHERGWSPPRFEHFLADAWCRLLLNGAT